MPCAACCSAVGPAASPLARARRPPDRLPPLQRAMPASAALSARRRDTRVSAAAPTWRGRAPNDARETPHRRHRKSINGDTAPGRELASRTFGKIRGKSVSSVIATLPLARSEGSFVSTVCCCCADLDDDGRRSRATHTHTARSEETPGRPASAGTRRPGTQRSVSAMLPRQPPRDLRQLPKAHLHLHMDYANRNSPKPESRQRQHEAGFDEPEPGAPCSNALHRLCSLPRGTGCTGKPNRPGLGLAHVNDFVDVLTLMFLFESVSIESQV